MRLLDQVAYRIKAVIAATFLALVGIAEWLVTDPDTATAIRSVVPEPYDRFVPVALGVLGTVLVHQLPIRQPAALTSAVAATEPDMNTTAITAVNAKNSGEFTGTGAE